ncbi:MAG: hydroxyisourate hydrolase [Vicinamibacterales bacterium]
MTISTHVLDTSVGRPAAGVAVELYRRADSRWMEVGRTVTNRDGRVLDFAASDLGLDAGEYRLIVDTGAYFRARGVDSFYGRIQIDFIAADADRAAHYHVPLLVSPFAYSTYRGT